MEYARSAKRLRRLAVLPLLGLAASETLAVDDTHVQARIDADLAAGKPIVVQAHIGGVSHGAASGHSTASRVVVRVRVLTRRTIGTTRRVYRSIPTAFILTEDLLRMDALR